MFDILTSINTDPDSPASIGGPTRGTVRIAVVQTSWQGSVEKQKLHYRQAAEEIRQRSVNLIILQELSLYPYACTREDAHERFLAEKLDGMSYQFAHEIAKQTGSHVVISLFEDAVDGKFNCAITVNPAGDIVLKTRKTHIPVTAGYFEDKYFEQGNSPVANVEISNALVGTPTCWDQWFPELARCYGLIKTDLICYPTAIGSEPDHPDFDTQPLWQHMMVAHGIANGMFIAAANRIGHEDGLDFYGSSFISDPYGRIVLLAPRNKDAILVADLHLDYKRDWLTLFPFFTTRRPEMYSSLTTREIN